MENPFVSIVTIYRADVGWYWADDRLHDVDYHIKVNDSVDKKVNEVAQKYGIHQDTQYRSQFEGVCVEGEDRVAVEKAATEIASHLARFKGIRPITGE